MNIKTQNICPPIPTRSHDWQAYDDDTYDGEGSKLGHGPTELAAIEDLLEKLGIEGVDAGLVQFIAETERLYPGRCAFCGERKEQCTCEKEVAERIMSQIGKWPKSKCVFCGQETCDCPYTGKEKP